MKIKLLALLLACGLFAFGAKVMAAEEAAPSQLTEENLQIGFGDITSHVCDAIQMLGDSVPPCCQTFCTGTFDIAHVGQCVATLYAFTQDAKMCAANSTTCQAYKKALSGLQWACTSSLSLCTGMGLACSSKTVKDACGHICANLKLSDKVKSCIGKDPSVYTKDGNCLTQVCDESNCKAPKKCVKGECVTPASGGCKANKDCTGNQTCVNGKCVTPPSGGCKANKDCTGNQTCVNGKCVAPSGGGCKANSDCTNGNTCTKAGKCTCGGGTVCTGNKKCVKNKCIVP
jgi:hypothetical protein